MRRGLVRVLLACVAGCASRAHDPASPAPAAASSDAVVARELGEALLLACPGAAADDEGARERCAQRLESIPELTSRMTEPFLWGAQATPTASFEEGAKTSFNPLAWRKIYLSLEMFSGAPRVVSTGRRTVLTLPSRFRNTLDPGEYPYPFWHSKPKWESYQLATEIIFVIEDGKIVGALRSALQDPSRPGNPRSFDGNWVWKDAKGHDQPSAALYSRMFSADNPHLAELDHAYRAFESEARPYNCDACHRPDNRAKQRPLEILLYPNQALIARHDIVRAIEHNDMPPANDAGAPAGITDDAHRQRLLELARSFEAAADAALASETQRRPE